MIDKLMQHGIGVNGGSNIKSIQSGNIQLVATETEVVISSVDLSKSFIMLSNNTDTTNASVNFVRGSFKNDSTIVFNRFSPLASNVSWFVVELDGNVKVQSGTSAIPAPFTSGTAVISPVNVANSFVVATFNSEANLTSLAYTAVKTSIRNETILDFNRAVSTNPGGIVRVSWFLIEQL